MAVLSWALTTRILNITSLNGLPCYSQRGMALLCYFMVSPSQYYISPVHPCPHRKLLQLQKRRCKLLIFTGVFIFGRFMVWLACHWRTSRFGMVCHCPCAQRSIH